MTVGEPARAQDRHAALASSMDNDPKPLSVIVIGAGIAGLTAAAALRKAGHIVQMSTRHVVKHVFEQSSFANELGAAIYAN
ncbi:hypothetical protein AnigIFM59636_003078 [Aspergillus niger]|uniref:FAD-dependent oxidoreductase 2 FAD-binding domain-containing protein n=1 Tax=Aspergillus niger ATCC 13496 TaxID=1353008 RepID=A0A370C203_ASPNG|nr:uncharacterized protein BO96DRAFT_449201 [Aspergillus niger CBS 101883]PYH53082.1 hypothetical protein BO96DRAFT_449201 [Aspergillus niger CBS 101883]RDH21069.1 hypothetical protein M747DRAFT_340992 [Aspergillus niger ATCC 13496]GJP87838.1 uncharacterized protein AlacWU_00737 [Aspergillus niger]GKZ90938.1 hypothetical protein AnigIFM59636_003078 [Aspergillus niger]